MLFSRFPINDAMVEFSTNKLNSEQLANKIFQYHSTNSKFYQNFLAKRIVESNALNWHSIPTITKKDFQIGINELLAGKKKRSLHIHNTSGSTGTPFYFAKDRFCHSMTWAYADFRLLEHGINIGDSLQARFYGIPISGRKYYKERLKDFIAGRYRFPVFDLSDEYLEGVITRFSERHFVYINGYTSSLVVFAKYLKKKHLVLKELCPSLRLVMPTSEVCDDFDRAIMEEAFGVKVINEYGAAELDIIAMENERGEWVINDKTLLVEILDTNNQPVAIGEEGRVVVTSLYNKAMPFIRYELGDSAILKGYNSRGQLCLDRVNGRINDIIRLPSGKISPGLTFYYISKKILEGGGNIKEFVIRQKNLNEFNLEYVSDRALEENQKELCLNALEEYLEKGLKLNFIQLKEIIRTGSGKMKNFISEL